MRRSITTVVYSAACASGGHLKARIACTYAKHLFMLIHMNIHIVVHMWGVYYGYVYL